MLEVVFLARAGDKYYGSLGEQLVAVLTSHPELRKAAITGLLALILQELRVSQLIKLGKPISFRISHELVRSQIRDLLSY